jgi:hypothetical protein
MGWEAGYGTPFYCDESFSDNNGFGQATGVSDVIIVPPSPDHIGLTRLTGEAIEKNGNAYQFPSGPSSPLATFADAAGIVQTYLLHTNAWLSISNQTLTVYTVTNGITNAVWSSMQAPPPPDLSAVYAQIDALQSQIDEFKAWGERTPYGEPNPEAAFLLSSGLQIGGSGAYGVFETSGATAFFSGSDGIIRISPDIVSPNNYWEIVSGGSVLVGAVAKSIALQNAGTQFGTVTIRYPYTSGDFPTMWFTPSLSTVPFDLQDGVVWVDNGDGTATVTCPATTSAGFWRATSLSTFDFKIRTDMPHLFEGGIFGDPNGAPVIYNDNVTTTINGQSYTFPVRRN